MLQSEPLPAHVGLRLFSFNFFFDLRFSILWKNLARVFWSAALFCLESMACAFFVLTSCRLARTSFALYRRFVLLQFFCAHLRSQSEKVSRDGAVSERMPRHRFVQRLETAPPRGRVYASRVSRSFKKKKICHWTPAGLKSRLSSCVTHAFVSFKRSKKHFRFGSRDNSSTHVFRGS